MVYPSSTDADETRLPSTEPTVKTFGITHHFHPFIPPSICVGNNNSLQSPTLSTTQPIDVLEPGLSDVIDKPAAPQAAESHSAATTDCINSTASVEDPLVSPSSVPTATVNVYCDVPPPSRDHSDASTAHEHVEEMKVAGTPSKTAADDSNRTLPSAPAHDVPTVPTAPIKRKAPTMVIIQKLPSFLPPENRYRFPCKYRTEGGEKVVVHNSRCLEDGKGFVLRGTTRVKCASLRKEDEEIAKIMSSLSLSSSSKSKKTQALPEEGFEVARRGIEKRASRRQRDRPTPYQSHTPKKTLDQQIDVILEGTQPFSWISSNVTMGCTWSVGPDMNSLRDVSGRFSASPRTPKRATRRTAAVSSLPDELTNQFSALNLSTS